jgi:hypothetical protein
MSIPTSSKNGAEWIWRWKHATDFLRLAGYSRSVRGLARNLPVVLCKSLLEQMVPAGDFRAGRYYGGVNAGT